MIDTHSHLYGPEFTDDIHEVVARARVAGIEHVLLPNINKESVQPMLSLCAAYPDYFSPMLGLHPEDVTSDYLLLLDEMEQALQTSNHPYVAVGEVGLDFYWETTYAEQQLDAFRRQVEWAVRYQLPLMIHCRAAHRQLIQILEDYRETHLSGVFHCFGGTLQEAEELLSFPGFALGIGGIVTFKKSHLPEVLSHVPVNRIVLETDAPYLAPSPYRGQRNESAFLVATRNKLAQIYSLSPDEIDECTNATVRRIFRGLKQC